MNIWIREGVVHIGPYLQINKSYSTTVKAFITESFTNTFETTFFFNFQIYFKYLKNPIEMSESLDTVNHVVWLRSRWFNMIQFSLNNVVTL